MSTPPSTVSTPAGGGPTSTPATEPASAPATASSSPPATGAPVQSASPPSSAVTPTAPAVPSGSESPLPVATAPPPEASLPARASARIAKRKQTAEELAESRRLKKRLTVRSTPAAAVPPSLPAGQTAGSAASGAVAPSSTPTPVPASGLACAAAQPAVASSGTPKPKRARKTAKSGDASTRAAAAAKPTAKPLGQSKRAPIDAQSTSKGAARIDPAAPQPADPSTIATVGVRAPPPHAALPHVFSVDSDSDADEEPEGLMHSESSAVSAPRPDDPAALDTAGSALPPPAPATPAAPVLMTPGEGDTGRVPFNLSDFLSQFHGGLHGAPAPSTQTVPGRPASNAALPLEHLNRAVGDDIDDLRRDPVVARLLAELAQALRQQRPAGHTSVRPAAADAAPAASVWTMPNARGVLPPMVICELREAHFPPPQQRARGDYVPAAIYILAAHRLYPYLLTPEGLHASPTSFIMRWRVVAALTFVVSAPIMIALYGARFGPCGVSIMHFRRAARDAVLAAGSSDASFAMDFRRTTAPPPPPACRSYNDLLSAVQGLMSFANAQWYPQIAQSLYRVREFVMANMDADPANSERRVRRTLQEVNMQLGAAFVHLSSDSPFWWREFSAAVGRIDYNSNSWAMALHELMVPPAPAASGPALALPAQHSALSVPARTGPRASERRGSRPGGFPAHIRALIPRRDDGVEPCLKFFAGSMCEGGTRERCASDQRTHTWTGAFPAALLEFIVDKFGHRGRGQSHRRT